MKKALTIILAITLFGICSINAQAPQAIKYQTIARDITGNILASQNVSFRISILQGSASGPNMYTETQITTTNPFGLANLNIGTGTVVFGNFSTINWGSNTYFVQMEFDPAGGSNYALMGTSQFLSVPYALYSERSGASSSDSSKWDQTGNVGTNPTINFIGTTDANDLSFRTNNAPTMLLKQDGSLILYNVNQNTFVGDSVGIATSSSTGMRNTFLGYYAGYSNRTGNNNTAIGFKALYNDTSGVNNTATGWLSLYSNTSGGDNTATGESALHENTSGASNVAVGNSSLFYNSSGSNNTAVGLNTLYNNTTGLFNTAIGREALNINVSGNYNTAIGYGADVTVGNLNNASAIGYNAKVSASNSIVLGGTGVDAVNVAIGMSNPPSKLTVTGGDVNITDIASGIILKSPNGQCWRVTVDNSGTLISTSITCP